MWEIVASVHGVDCVVEMDDDHEYACHRVWDLRRQVRDVPDAPHYHVRAA